jgi:hypothetical protein
MVLVTAVAADVIRTSKGRTHRVTPQLQAYAQEQGPPNCARVRHSETRINTATAASAAVPSTAYGTHPRLLCITAHLSEGPAAPVSAAALTATPLMPRTTLAHSSTHVSLPPPLLHRSSTPADMSCSSCISCTASSSWLQPRPPQLPGAPPPLRSLLKHHRPCASPVHTSCSSRISCSASNSCLQSSPDLMMTPCRPQPGSSP